MIADRSTQLISYILVSNLCIISSKVRCCVNFLFLCFPECSCVNSSSNYILSKYWIFIMAVDVLWQFSHWPFHEQIQSPDKAIQVTCLASVREVMWHWLVQRKKNKNQVDNNLPQSSQEHSIPQRTDLALSLGGLCFYCS